MLNTENVNARLNRLERRTAQLRLCVFLLVGYVLLSSGVGHTIANVSDEIRATHPGPKRPTPPEKVTEPHQSREQAKTLIARPTTSKPALTTQVAVNDLIKTRRLQLVDDKGVAVLDFYANPSSTHQDYPGGVIDINNGNGKPVMQLSSNGGGHLRILKDDGTDFMFFGKSSGSSPAGLISLGGNGTNGILELKHENDQVGAGLAVNSAGTPRLRLSNKHGNRLVVLDKNPYGNGRLQLFDPKQDESGSGLGARFNINNRGGSIKLYNSSDSAESTSLFEAAASDDGHGYLLTQDKTGHDLFYVGPSGDNTASMMTINHLGSDLLVSYLGESTANTGHLELTDSAGHPMVVSGTYQGNGFVDIQGVGNKGIPGISYGTPMSLLGSLDAPHGDGLLQTWTSSGKTIFSSDSVTVVGSGLTSDIDGDGDVDGDDFLLLSEHFGLSSTKKTAATEKDGK